METKKIVLTCYLVHSYTPENYRFIATNCNTTLETAIKSGESILSQIDFDDEFQEGFVAKLIEEFALDATAEFIVHLLNHGITELRNNKAKLILNIDTPIRLPKGFITKGFQKRYMYLVDEYNDGAFVLYCCIEIMMKAMEMINFHELPPRSSLS